MPKISHETELIGQKMQAGAPQTGSGSVQIRWISNMLHNHAPSMKYSRARLHNSKVNSTADGLRKLTWGNVDRKLLQLSDMNSIAAKGGMCLSRFLYMCIPSLPDSTRTQFEDEPSSRKLEYYTSRWPWVKTFDHVAHQVRTWWSWPSCIEHSYLCSSAVTGLSPCVTADIHILQPILWPKKVNRLPREEGGKLRSDDLSAY